MAQKILLKKSAVAEKVPAASGLSYGEITINYASGNNANNFIAARRADDATTGSASILIYDKKFNDKTYAPITHSHTVDSTTSTTSTNPVQNAVITKYVTGFSSNVVTALNGKAASTHDHISLKANTDNRNDETKPNDYNSVFKIAGLKYSTAVASPSNSTYGAVAGIRAWGEKSGGEAHELFFDGANGNIYHRVGEDTSWESWKQLAHTDDIPTIPTVNDSKVTIKQNGTQKGSFTLNQAGTTTIELTDKDTTYTTGTTDTAGLTKLFTTTGTATGGAINQSAMTTLLKGKSDTGHTHDERYYTQTQIDTKLNGKSDTGHTHNYAGSSSAGGAATSANKLNSDAGSATQPIYFKDGVPSACAYTLGASVPSGAKFTDTTYTTGTTGTAGLTKLFTTTGTATGGAINQSAMTTLLKGKSDTGHTHVATAITLGADITYTSQLDTAQTVTIANRGDALDDALSGITKALIDDEEVIAGAITDLNTKINDFAITAEESGTGNVVTGISADGKKVIAKKGSINPSFTVSNDSADTVYLIGSKLGDSINTSTTQYASTAIPWSFDYKVWMKGSNLYAASDARLKVFDEENEVFDWGKFEQIPVKYYRWKDKPFGKAQIGTCAQTINEIYPEVVCQHADGTYGVAYDRLALISVEGVKKLRQELEEKERENTELKATVSSLTEDLVDLTYTSRTFTLTTTGEGDATISMERKTTGSGITFRIDYSYDNVEWVNNWDFSPITLKNGETLYLRGRCPRGTYSPFDYLTFVFSGTSANTRIVADGYLYKLIGSGKEKLTTLNKYDGANTAAFANLFSGCTMLFEANLNLCATGLSSNAYKDLFNGCTALTNTPEINILEQGAECAKGMFYGCSNIVDASNITVSSSTYGSMSFSGAFYGCSSLKTGPSLYCDSGLVAYRACINMFGNCNSLTGVGGNFNNVQLQSEACENMFYGCTALTTPIPISIASLDSKSCSYMFTSCKSLVESPMPSLPGNTHCDKAYAYMFMNCKSLKRVPELSALTVGSGCYVGMFAECTALEKGPTIRLQYYSAETVADMFRTCNSLKSVKLDSPVRISSDMATCSWFRSNTGSGVLYYVNKGLSSNEVGYLESSLPSGWTVKDWTVQDETN